MVKLLCYMNIFVFVFIDIILRCYPVVEEKDLTKRDINQKLSELLKPSAVAKKFGSMEK